ncbi:MAG: class I mannose-6-phosphate isomerase [Sphingomonadaceae bacterium]|nr:class I mannose-6-phosphate isomerase [Sphingomonadaceae bacterium]
MGARRLTAERVEKVWGRRDLGPWFDDVDPDHAAIGEIWFAAPGDPELMVKVLFTSERLSIQVHPDDAAARAAGYPRGKDEAWLVLAAEPRAVIGIGTKRPLSAAELRAAAIDGSIETLLDWRPAMAGDVYYSPARTVHAIGPGLVLVEVQQNVDLTYRLYDYGRPRDLQLDEGVAVARAVPFGSKSDPFPIEPGRTRLAQGPAFTMERWDGAGCNALEPRCAWVTCLAGSAHIGGAVMRPGECWLGNRGSVIDRATDASLLVAYPPDTAG